MRHLKTIVVSILVLVLLFGSMAMLRLTTYAVTDTCSFSGVDVPTEFNATHPATVKQGDTFTISGLSSKPSNSYGVTVYKSNLQLSATNSSPVSYSKYNTSTNPSPTTGQTSYTAYYPSWSLKATGAVGSFIVVKLVSATATIDNGSGGQVDIPCNLSQTVANIKIIAKSNTTKSVDDKEDEEEKPIEKAPDVIIKSDEKKGEEKKDKNDSLDQPKDTDNESVADVPSEIMSQLRDVTILVNDSRGNPAQGAKVTMDGQLTVETDNGGQAKFESIRLGEHQIKVVLGDTTFEQSLQVSEDEAQNSISITLPSRMNPLQIGLLVGGSLLILGALGFVVKKILAKGRTKQIVYATHAQNTGEISTFNQPTQMQTVQQSAPSEVPIAGATTSSNSVHSLDSSSADQSMTDKMA